MYNNINKYINIDSFVQGWESQLKRLESLDSRCPVLETTAAATGKFATLIPSFAVWMERATI